MRLSEVAQEDTPLTLGEDFADVFETRAAEAIQYFEHTAKTPGWDEEETGWPTRPMRGFCGPSSIIITSSKSGKRRSCRTQTAAGA